MVCVLYCILKDILVYNIFLETSSRVYPGNVRVSWLKNCMFGSHCVLLSCLLFVVTLLGLNLRLRTISFHPIATNCIRLPRTASECHELLQFVQGAARRCTCGRPQDNKVTRAPCDDPVAAADAAGGGGARSVGSVSWSGGRAVCCAGAGQAQTGRGRDGEGVCPGG